MSMSQFQQKKLESVYSNMYDSNKDGVIDEDDFNFVIQKISDLHHWGKNDDAYKEAKKTLKEIWKGLRDEADSNNDGKVTLTEWLDMWTRTLALMEKGQQFPDWQKKYMEFMFYANDTSGDGFIDRGEYITIQTMFGNKTEDCEKAFDKLAGGLKNKMISKDDFETLWREYFLSNDGNKGGNYLFGLPPN